MATLLIDLDGVIWHRNKLVNRKIPSVIKKLHGAGHKIYFLTNNSGRSSLGHQRKLSRMGIKIPASQILCTMDMAVKYLKKQIKGTKLKPTVFIVGNEGLKKAIGRLPVKIAKINENVKIGYVMVGLDRKFNYKKLAKAQNAILLGAKFIVMNRDNVMPVGHDKAMPGCGSIVSAIEAAAGTKPYVIGKPNPCLIKDALKNKPHNGKTYIIGDSLDSDIVLGSKLRFETILVLSGVTSGQDLKRSKIKPKYVIKDFIHIGKIING